MMMARWPSADTVWCLVMAVMAVMVNEVMTLSGPNVCMVQQKYNITKRVKYRAPMSVRTYVWCFDIPPRCSKWKTEMRDLTRLETEERTAEVAVCCPGYKMKDVACVPICPSGKMGHGCSEDCPPDKWGPNCVNECPECQNGFCVPSTGECDCEEGWQGESCQISMSTVQAASALMEELLTATKSTIRILPTTKTTTMTTAITESSIPTSTPKVIFTETSTVPTPESTLMTVPSTKVTLTSTDKTEIILTSVIKSTSLSKMSTIILEYENVSTTPFTTEYSEMQLTENITRVTVPTFIYNRTDSPDKGTFNMSGNFSNEHETSTVLSPLTSLVFSTSPSTSTTDAAISSTTPAPSTSSMTTTTKFTSTTSSPRTIVTNPSTTTTTEKLITISTEDSTKLETTNRTETTSKNPLTTLKFKPKEIWIKPTQKGVPIYIETKVKNHETHAKFKSDTHKNEVASENTTLKTIIVSIIPTSVSHATFKKIALTTASYLSHRANSTKFNKTEQSFTKSMTSQASTAKPFTTKLLYTVNVRNSSKVSTPFPQSKATIKNTPSTKKVFLNTTKFSPEKHTTLAILNSSMEFPNTTIAISSSTMATSITNSMTSTLNANKKLNSSTFLTIKPPTNKYLHKIQEVTTEYNANKKSYVKDEAIYYAANKKSNANDNEKEIEIAHMVATTTGEKFHINNNTPVIVEVTEAKKNYTTNLKSTNSTKDITNKWNIKNVTKASANNLVTQEPVEDETFHILTEPEHITAVMSDRERDHTSVDLISVISIAGGVMMAVITVAVVIVMMERCKRTRYQEVRKMNDIRMQVMIDKDPPPYVRSIFHTPLPDPPTSDNCHYQPISTLDRNLKQFMRPVVVQAISPVMLENFRGILECHYDHLPNRNHRINQDFGTMPTRCSVSPSMKCDDELLRQRPLSVADYTIEALKCEAKMDIIDNTTSEPLYAEIPCWRPPSEHAVEVLNLNGEAVTEL